MFFYTSKRTVRLSQLARLLIVLLASASLWACKPANDDSAASATTAKETALRAAGLELDKHYKIIANPLATTLGKVSVSEFFWYGCSHCEAFEPTVHAWEKTLPSTVEFQQVPAVWAKPMELHARAFYIAETLPNSAALHAALFKLIIAVRSNPNIEEQRDKIADVFAAHGLSKDDFLQQLKAKSIEDKLSNAMARMKQAGVQSTPSLVVNGRYLVLNSTAEKAEDITAIADKLIAIENK